MVRWRWLLVLAAALWGTGVAAAGPVRVEERRLILLPLPQEWSVIEMVAVYNPGTAPVAPLTLPLPVGAGMVQLVEGFDPDGAEPRGDEVVDRAGLGAGQRRRLFLMYRLPGSGDLAVAVPLAGSEDRVDVVVPAGVAVSAPDGRPGTPVTLNGQEFARHTVPVTPGQAALALRVSRPAPGPAPAASAGSGASTAAAPAGAAGGNAAGAQDWLHLAANAGVILLLLLLPILGARAPGDEAP